MRCDECGQFSRYKRCWHAEDPVVPVDDHNCYCWQNLEDEAADFHQEQRPVEVSGVPAEVHVNQPVEDEDAPF